MFTCTLQVVLPYARLYMRRSACQCMQMATHCQHNSLHVFLHGSGQCSVLYTAKGLPRETKGLHATVADLARD